MASRPEHTGPTRQSLYSAAVVTRPSYRHGHRSYGPQTLPAVPPPKNMPPVATVQEGVTDNAVSSGTGTGYPFGGTINSACAGHACDIVIGIASDMFQAAGIPTTEA